MRAQKPPSDLRGKSLHFCRWHDPKLKSLIRGLIWRVEVGDSMWHVTCKRLVNKSSQILVERAPSVAVLWGRAPLSDKDLLLFTKMWRKSPHYRRFQENRSCSPSPSVLTTTESKWGKRWEGRGDIKGSYWQAISFEESAFCSHTVVPSKNFF